MGRTRDTDTGNPKELGGSLIFRRTASVILIVLACACEVITQDFDRIIAIEIDGGTSRTVMVGDSLTLSAAAINASGDPVPSAKITWSILDVDSGQVGFTLEPAGLLVGVSEGQGRVQARVENLRSDPITISVTPADTTAPDRPTVVASLILPSR